MFSMSESGSGPLDCPLWSKVDLRDTDLCVGQRIGKRYRIISKLGSGGMGDVYCAEDQWLDESVALKFLSRSRQQKSLRCRNLRREVKIGRHITHPNVCRIFDIETMEDRVFFSMEYISESLRDRLDQAEDLPIEEAIAFGVQIGRGLTALHRQGVRHGDLKPANVMIGADGEARVADFGLASLVAEAGGYGVHGGTPAYMAPEQFLGQRPTLRSDLFSFGLVLYEMVTGQDAYDRDFAQRQGPPIPPSCRMPGLDVAVDRLILDCLAEHPDERPSSAVDVVRALCRLKEQRRN